MHFGNHPQSQVNKDCWSSGSLPTEMLILSEKIKINPRALELSPEPMAPTSPPSSSPPRYESRATQSQLEIQQLSVDGTVGMGE
jgi:hypothetical protein